MKVLFRILIAATILGTVYYYSVIAEDAVELLQGPSGGVQPLPTTVLEADSDSIARPVNGLSTYVGQSIDGMLSLYGQPVNRYMSAYGYEWWHYNIHGNLLLIGVTDDIVTQVYTNELAFDVSPYTIGQSLDDINRMTIFEQEVTVNIDENIYMFMMREEDLYSRILVKYDGVYAQLYIDKFSNKLVGIRYLDGETLVLHQPYELQYVGDLIQSPTPSSFLQQEIDIALSAQLLDLVNNFRVKYDAQTLARNDNLNIIARAHSEDMFLVNSLSHESLTSGTLEDRLNEQQIQYEEVSENLASNYVDAIGVVHGWLNSEEHREVMLDERFTHIGSGVFVNYYTQIFVTEKLVAN